MVFIYFDEILDERPKKCDERTRILIIYLNKDALQLLYLNKAPCTGHKEKSPAVWQMHKQRGRR